MRTRAHCATHVRGCPLIGGVEIHPMHRLIGGQTSALRRERVVPYRDQPFTWTGTFGMSPISSIEVARARRSRRVLFVGNPTRYNDVSQWAMVRQWVALHGLEPIRELEGDVLCVIVTEDILDGRCSPKESAAVQHAHALGVPCISVHDTTLIWQVTARVRSRIRESAVVPAGVHRDGA